MTFECRTRGQATHVYRQHVFQPGSGRCQLLFPKAAPWQVSGGSIHQGLLPKGRRIVSDLDPFHLHRPLTLFQHGLHLEAALITSIPYFSIKKVCCDVMQHSKLDFRRFELKVMQKRSAMFRDVG